VTPNGIGINAPASLIHAPRYHPTLHNHRPIPAPRLAGRHQPLRLWMLCLYFMGLNLSNRQIASELGLDGSDVQAMTEQLRRGLVAKAPEATLNGEVEPDVRASSGIDEVYVVAGHKGQPEEVAKRGGSDGAADWQARRAAAR